MAQIITFVVAVYCYTHAMRTYLRQEPPAYFSEAGPPSKKIFPYGNLVEQRFGFTGKFSGCKDRPKINFKTAVAEGKQRWHVCSKTPASRAVRMMFPSFQALFCEPLPKHTDV